MNEFDDVPEKCCGICGAYDKRTNTCRREEPKMLFDGSSKWPLVFNTDWCMKWSPKATEIKTHKMDG